MRKIISVILAFTLALCLCVGCTNAKKIIGTWENEQTVLGVVTKNAYTFFEDGSGIMSTVLGVELDFTYKIEGDKLYITTTVLSIEDTETYTVKISGDTLTLTQDGKAHIYHRA